MTSQSFGTQIRLLKTICSRLDAANSVELPFVATTLASSLPLCKDLLSYSDDQLKRSQGNAHVIVQRFRAKISSLIQDKVESHKLAAIRLIKAVVNVGGYEVLAKCGHWVRGLVNCLNSKIAAQRQLAIVALVNIYKSTHGLPILVREITTPTLPTFITTCINAIAPKDRESEKRGLIRDENLISTTLIAFTSLIPNHPATFRPFVTQLTEILGIIIAPAASSRVASSKLCASAQRLHAQLHRCATKNEGGPNGRWLHFVRLLSQQVVHTSIETFRSVDLSISSQPEHSSDMRQYASTKSRPEEPPYSEILDGLHLPKWVGLNAGVSRLIGLLQTLEAYIATGSRESYILPVYSLANTFERCLAAFPGQRISDLSAAIRRPDYSSEETEELFLHLNGVQIAVLQNIAQLLHRLGTTNKGFVHGILEDLLWRFRDAVDSVSLRASFYDTVKACIESTGPSITETSGKRLELMVTAACADMLDESNRGRNNGEKTSASRHRQDADAYFQTSQRDLQISHKHEARKAASSFIETVLRRIPASAISNSSRSAMDRAAILSRHQPAMFASVFNTPSQQSSSRQWSSNLPFLAREFPRSLFVEGMVRPRMPIISSRVKSKDGLLNGNDLGDSLSIASADESGHMSTGTPEVLNAENMQSGDVRDGLMQLEESKGSEQPIISGSIGPAFKTTETNKFGGNQADIGRTGETSALAFPFSEAPIVPPSPKRARVHEVGPGPDDSGDEVKRVKLATFEPAPGPTSVSAIEENDAVVSAPLLEGGEDDSSDDSEIPPIIMDDDDEDEDED